MRGIFLKIPPTTIVLLFPKFPPLFYNRMLLFINMICIIYISIVHPSCIAQKNTMLLIFLFHRDSSSHRLSFENNFSYNMINMYSMSSTNTPFCTLVITTNRREITYKLKNCIAFFFILTINPNIQQFFQV